MMLIAIPSGGTVKNETVSCLLDSLNYIPVDKYVQIIKGGYPAHSRNLMVTRAQEAKASHLMMIDADMVFPPDGIKRLLEANKPIIGANYNEKKFPLTSTIKLADKDNKLINYKSEDLPTKLFPCHAVATGFVLFNMEIFKQLKQPYFEYYDDGNEQRTEDIYFCMKAQEVGIDVWCDPTIQVRHLGDYLY